MSRSLPAAMTTLLQSLKSKEVYFHTTLIYLGERIFGITISFVVYTALTRVYGPTLIGAYSYVQTVMLFALPFLGRRIGRHHYPRIRSAQAARGTS